MASLDSLISLQSSGQRLIGEPSVPRPIGIQQGSVLVVLDVNKGVSPSALYWTLANVARRGDTVKILGIITHVANAMGFMIRVDQSTRTSPNIMELQFEIATKKEAIWRTAHMKEWCQRAGVKLDVNVKAGNIPKVIAVDEAKSIGAYHVVLDKHMKKDKKYFGDNLTCFVSRWRSSGGVEIIRSFAMSNKLPPMAPTTPKGTSQAGHQSKASVGSNASYRGASSMSSTSFELGGESSDGEFSFHEGDPLSASSVGDSIDHPLHLAMRTSPHKQPPNLYNLLRGPARESGDIGYMNNPLRKPAVLKWLSEDDRINVNELERINVTELDRINVLDQQQGHLTPRAEFCFDQAPFMARNDQSNHSNHLGSHAWMLSGQLNVAPEFGQRKMGRHSLTASLQTQASFNNGRKHFRPDKLSMDVHWALMHWADRSRSARLRPQQFQNSTVTLSSNNSMSNFRAAVRKKVPVSTSLNYGDMVDSD